MQQRLGLGRRAGRWRLGMPAVPRWWEPLGARLLAERDRWLLWLPVCLGLGIAAFFTLPAQPPLAAGLAAILLAAMASFLAWRADRARAALARVGWIAAAACAAGFALAQARLEAVQAPVLVREATYDVTGRVAALEPRGRGVRLSLDQLTLSRVPPDATPKLVRLTLASGGDELAPGDRIRLRARLQPPQPPALPGGFDYARQAYFEQLGGLGYAMGKPEILAAAADKAGGIAALRAQIARRITEIVPGPAGAFAAAMIAGVRAAIDNDTWRAFQVSGLAHLISISGLHMTLVAGTAFLVARFALALIPWLALRIRVHKPAAVLAFAAVGFYALLAGNTVPTQRSFLMITVALLAVLVDRNPFSLRVLAWAAVVVLALRPEALFGASFQLSFAAVLALMATYETFRLRALKGDGETGVLGHCLRYVLGVAATTLIAGSATAPFAAYHFQTFATYGVLANLIAVPLTSFVVMPAGLLGLALMPLGLDRPAFQLMGLGSEAVLETAKLVADLPGASIAVAAVAGGGPRPRHHGRPLDRPLAPALAAARPRPMRRGLPARPPPSLARSGRRPAARCRCPPPPRRPPRPPRLGARRPPARELDARPGHPRARARAHPRRRGARDRLRRPGLPRPARRRHHQPQPHCRGRDRGLRPGPARDRPRRAGALPHRVRG